MLRALRKDKNVEVGSGDKTWVAVLNHFNAALTIVQAQQQQKSAQCLVDRRSSDRLTLLVLLLSPEPRCVQGRPEAVLGGVLLLAAARWCSSRCAEAVGVCRNHQHCACCHRKRCCQCPGVLPSASASAALHKPTSSVCKAAQSTALKCQACPE
ncbi:hypothetical protein GQ54DRAFT_96363 [Martensiomyces pterosporus]|nr:hypothetical protein GQ54DRAFT_96363 [Martensiomyces pterosporus]